MKINTAIGRFRLVGIMEGISFLLLLLVGMPLKYMAGIPEAVKYMGWAHGLLFILYVLTMTQAASKNNWSIGKTVVSFVMSLIPAGPFIHDKKLREEKY